MQRAGFNPKKMTKTTRQPGKSARSEHYRQKQSYEQAMTLVLLDTVTAQIQTIQLKVEIASKPADCQVMIEPSDGLYIQCLTEFEAKHEATKNKAIARPTQNRAGRLRPSRQNRLQSH